MSEPQRATEEGQKLTTKQQRFVEAYCGVARFNATEAARLAGYSDKSASRIGFDLKKTPSVRARIDAYLAENTLNASEILHELTDVAMRGLGEFVEATRYNAEGEPIAARMDASAKLKALELLGKHHALFTDNVSLGGGVEITIRGVDVDKL